MQIFSRLNLPSPLSGNAPPQARHEAGIHHWLSTRRKPTAMEPLARVLAQSFAQKSETLHFSKVDPAALHDLAAHLLNRVSPHTRKLLWPRGCAKEVAHRIERELAIDQLDRHVILEEAGPLRALATPRAVSPPSPKQFVHGVAPRRDAGTADHLSEAMHAAGVTFRAPSPWLQTKAPFEAEGARCAIRADDVRALAAAFSSLGAERLSACTAESLIAATSLLARHVPGTTLIATADDVGRLRRAVHARCTRGGRERARRDQPGPSPADPGSPGPRVGPPSGPQSSLRCSALRLRPFPGSAFRYLKVPVACAQSLPSSP